MHAGAPDTARSLLQCAYNLYRVCSNVLYFVKSLSDIHGLRAPVVRAPEILLVRPVVQGGFTYAFELCGTGVSHLRCHWRPATWRRFGAFLSSVRQTPTLYLDICADRSLSTSLQSIMHNHSYIGRYMISAVDKELFNSPEINISNPNIMMT